VLALTPVGKTLLPLTFSVFLRKKLKKKRKDTITAAIHILKILILSLLLLKLGLFE
jgi:hypothetical protein